MGEFVKRDPSDPHYIPESKGMDAQTAKTFAALAGVASQTVEDPKVAMAKMIAAQTGKSLEEVMAFIGESGTVAPKQVVDAQPVELPEQLKGKTIPLPREDEKMQNPNSVKSKANDSFVEVNEEDLSDAELDRLSKEMEKEEEFEQNWDGKIREGSRVKVVFMVKATKLNVINKIGKVTRVIGNEHAKVYEVEFKGKKVPKVRRNKKTGKIERGYENKVVLGTFSEDQLELAD